MSDFAAPSEGANFLGKRSRSSNDAEDASSKSGQRRKLACQRCRTRKVKCDQVRPQCGFCKSVDAECVFLEKPEDKLSLDPATRVMVNRLNQILGGVERINNRMDSNGIKMQARDAGSTTVTRTSSQAHASGSQEPLIELVEEYLEIPSCVASPDSVLTWPIFGNKFPPNYLIDFLDGLDTDSSEEPDTFQLHGDMCTIFEHQIPNLIERFLSNVHTKNPILDVHALVRMGRKAVEQGFGWDAQSCLVLLACALGTVSRPFVHALANSSNLDSGDVGSTDQSNSSSSIYANDLRLGDSFFHLASRRLGLLRFTVLGCQCHFFAGVYLMYTFRPLEAWTQFYQASISYQFFLKTVGGPSSETPLLYDAERLQRISKSRRRQEQAAYWSCFKSEIEFRVELPLMQSPVSKFEYPALFPSPPEVASEEDMSSEAASEPLWHQVIEATYGSGVREYRSSDSVTSFPDEAQEPRRHSYALYNEQESWYYYLTEVALRRIGNRIINTFYRVSREAWLNVEPWIPLAKEFDAQINTWSATLPSEMQSFNDFLPLPGHGTTSSGETQDPSISDPNANSISASKELSWCTENRLLEMRCRLYQPFLYCAIHYGHIMTAKDSHGRRLSRDHQKSYQNFVKSGISCHLKTLRWRTLRHRHHGIWFDMRSVIAAMLILCAAVQSRAVHVPRCIFATGGSPPHGRRTNCGEHEEYCISFETVFNRLKFWEDETRDMKQSRLVLEDIVKAVRAQEGL